MSNAKSGVALVTEMIEPTVTALELELWGIDLTRQGRFSLLRIYIEHEDGVTIEDCAKVSRQVSALLDVEEPITGEYTLEVSSPGLDRPLFTAAQYEQYIGSEIDLRLRNALQGRRKFKGKIVKVIGDNVCLLVDDAEIDLVHSDIEKANVVY
ncbi:MAG: ribosome maturation factor RimP [SAR86 cluster bacterium]|uniref:Ribosome maturation factor RimP n=1 Tax=SAR86 cluster bacterium TaxID=2030880 RepID=A0A2A5AU11_9GAMM|nr:MAG: ribosome maturation factor RimP [SAR86 cluster bacterium]